MPKLDEVNAYGRESARAKRRQRKASQRKSARVDAMMEHSTSSRRRLPLTQEDRVGVKASSHQASSSKSSYGFLDILRRRRQSLSLSNVFKSSKPDLDDSKRTKASDLSSTAPPRASTSTRSRSQRHASSRSSSGRSSSRRSAARQTGSNRVGTPVGRREKTSSGRSSARSGAGRVRTHPSSALSPTTTTSSGSSGRRSSTLSSRPSHRVVDPRLDPDDELTDMRSSISSDLARSDPSLRSKLKQHSVHNSQYRHKVPDTYGLSTDYGKRPNGPITTSGASRRAMARRMLQQGAASIRPSPNYGQDKSQLAARSVSSSTATKSKPGYSRQLDSAGRRRSQTREERRSVLDVERQAIVARYTQREAAEDNPDDDIPDFSASRQRKYRPGSALQARDAGKIQATSTHKAQKKKDKSAKDEKSVKSASSSASNGQSGKLRPSASYYRRQYPPVELNSRGQYRGPVGLQNLGNTCFMNSCLQCVCSTPALINYFATGQYKTDINKRSRCGGLLAAAFADLILSLRRGRSGDVERPMTVKRTVARIAPRFSGYGQQDVQEFLQFLLDGLHDDLNKIVRKPAYEEIKDKDTDSDETKSARWWANYSARNDSFLSDLFCGQLKSEVVCSRCKHVSNAYDPSWGIQVPIPKMRTSFFSSSACSIYDCLDAYTTEERLSGMDQTYCSKCKKHRDSTKALSIYRLPYILVITIKRFGERVSRFSVSRQKLNTLVKFPVRGLEMAPYCANKNETHAVYDLFAVANHSGMLGGGHYTAYGKIGPDDDDWYCFNDSRAYGVSTSKLQGSAAYVLFYQRRE